MVVKVTCTMPGRVTLRGLSVPLGIYFVPNALLIYEMIRMNRLLALCSNSKREGRHKSALYHPSAEHIPMPPLV